jgi:homoserine O-succinyltransferase/O-acetyltransferase
MTILLHPDLPASHSLAAEGVSVAAPQPSGPAAAVAPLRIALVNLMPNKVQTETQFARVLAASPLSVELTLVLPDSYRPTHVAADHLEAFYRRFREVEAERFDGVIVTGAPIETLPFEQVSYWAELRRIFDWARQSARSTFAVCWAGQAALQHFHGVPKHPLPAKKFGVYGHRVLRPQSPLLQRLGPELLTPVSRHTEVRRDDIPAGAGLEILADSPEAGLCLVADQELRLVCMFNHPEYDADTLGEEYVRDHALGRPIALPVNYFPGDDPERAPEASWADSARRLFGNWLEELHRHRSAGAERPRGARIASSTGPVLVGRAAAELSIRASDVPDAIVEVLRALDRESARPLRLRSRRLGGGEQVIEMRIEALGEVRLERLSKRLLRSGEIHDLAYRVVDGSAGLYAVNANWRPETELAAAG